MNSWIKKISVVCAGVLCLAGQANAHLVAFGWKDLGNGTIRMYGQHWHGNQSSAYSDNGGVRIGTWDASASTQNTASWQLFNWTGVMNDVGGDTASNDALVASGVLDGWAEDVGNRGNTNGHNDWFFTDPLVLGNGNWGLFTGTSCCVDTMTAAQLFTITGISSVPIGTGPGSATSVPAPATLGMFALSLVALRRFRRS